MTEKEKFLRKFNEAYAKSDTDYIVDQVTDDIVWTIAGDDTIRGKENFKKATKEMESENPVDLTILNVITHGRDASVNGIIKMKTSSGEERQWAFCDVYKFSGFKNPKISEMISYIVEVKTKAHA